jgi:hypothetical protein
VGLVLDGDGFPKAHELFEGTRQDRGTLGAMLDRLEQRTGKRPGATVVVDRGMTSPDNLDQIWARGLHHIVAGCQSERTPWERSFRANKTPWWPPIRSNASRIAHVQKEPRLFYSSSPALDTGGRAACRSFPSPSWALRHPSLTHRRRSGASSVDSHGRMPRLCLDRIHRSLSTRPKAEPFIQRCGICVILVVSPGMLGGVSRDSVGNRPFATGSFTDATRREI